MYVKDVGEARLIEMLAEAIVSSNTVFVDQPDEFGFRLRLPAGDDAALWDGPSGIMGLTTDTMVEGVHFNMAWMSWTDLGWKAVAINLSDIAAMGCAPLYSVVSLGLHGDLPVDGLIEMYGGMLEACCRYGGTIVGGDIVRSSTFFVSLSMIGTVPSPRGNESQQRSFLMRSSAIPGETIAVTGSLGCSAGGLRMLRQGCAVSFDGETSTHLSNAHNRPTPRVTQGMALARHGVATAMDISDGLVKDLGKLCKASDVGGRLYSHKVPADTFLRQAYPNDYMSLALSGGEDYEILFTASSKVVDKIVQNLDVPVSIIGEVVDGPPTVTVLDENGRLVDLGNRGWDHFRKS